MFQSMQAGLLNAYKSHSGEDSLLRSAFVLSGGPARRASGRQATTLLLHAAIAAAGFLAISPAVASSETDLFPDPAWAHPGELSLSKEQNRRADALALYVTAIFAEENEGPESAIARFRQVLALEPGFLGLALQLARESLRRGETAEALALVKDAAKARPSDFLPDFFAAEIYLRQLSKPDLAERHARKARELAPDRFAPYELLWEIYQYTGEQMKSRLILENAMSRNAAEPDFWIALAQLHRRMMTADGRELPADRARRLSALSRAADLAEGNAEKLVQVADLHAIFREVEEAAALYSEAYAIKPGLPTLRDKLAAALIELRRFSEATPLLEKIFSENPQNLAACDQLALFALERGDYEDALLYRQKALALAPGDPNRHHELIDLLLSRQKYELAMVYLQDAMEQFPRSGIFAYVLGATLTRAGRPEEAIPFFEQALLESTLVRAQFVGGEFYFEFGMAAEQAGEYDRAAELFRKAIEIDPANAARAANYLGYMWVERNMHLDEAELLIRSAIEAEPSNGAYLDSLGWLLYRRGHYAEALSTLMRAAELLPEPDPVVLDHIADAYMALGRTPEALLYWQKALQLDQENIALQEKIERTSARTASAVLE